LETSVIQRHLGDEGVTSLPLARERGVGRDRGQKFGAGKGTGKRQQQAHTDVC